MVGITVSAGERTGARTHRISADSILVPLFLFLLETVRVRATASVATRARGLLYAETARAGIFDTLHFVLGKLFRHPRCNQNLKKWKRPIIPSLPGFNHAFTGRKRIRGALSISPIRLVVRGMTATVCTLFSISICSNPFISGTCRSSRLWTRTSSV